MKYSDSLTHTVLCFVRDCCFIMLHFFHIFSYLLSKMGEKNVSYVMYYSHMNGSLATLWFWFWFFPHLRAPDIRPGMQNFIIIHFFFTFIVSFTYTFHSRIVYVISNYYFFILQIPINIQESYIQQNGWMCIWYYPMSWGCGVYYTHTSQKINILWILRLVLFLSCYSTLKSCLVHLMPFWLLFMWVLFWRKHSNLLCVAYSITISACQRYLQLKS